MEAKEFASLLTLIPEGNMGKFQNNPIHDLIKTAQGIEDFDSISTKDLEDLMAASAGLVKQGATHRIAIKSFMGNVMKTPSTPSKDIFI